MTWLDLNCDLGEGAGNDAAVMPHITSANIACGGHAGDPATMRDTVALARAHGVGIGAHPGYEDRAGFGRAERAVGPGEAATLVLRQTAALADTAGDALRHVKLHGALYNQVARDPGLAAAVAAALAREWPRLIVFAPAASCLAAAARQQGLAVAEEVFADRGYRGDGTLMPRNQPGALIHDEAQAAAQVLGLALRGEVTAVDGTYCRLKADTVCLHGDSPRVVEFALRLRRELAAAGIGLRTFAA